MKSDDDDDLDVLEMRRKFRMRSASRLLLGGGGVAILGVLWILTHSVDTSRADPRVVGGLGIVIGSLIFLIGFVSLVLATLNVRFERSG